MKTKTSTKQRPTVNYKVIVGDLGYVTETIAKAAALVEEKLDSLQERLFQMIDHNQTSLPTYQQLQTTYEVLYEELSDLLIAGNLALRSLTEMLIGVSLDSKWR